jgi:hypothetical protein
MNKRVALIVVLDASREDGWDKQRCSLGSSSLGVNELGFSAASDGKVSACGMAIMLGGLPSKAGGCDGTVTDRRNPTCSWEAR